MSEALHRPMTTTEAEVAAIWSDLLGREIGPGDDLFAAGGTSLTAIKFLQRVANRFGPDALSPEALYADPTLSGVAGEIDAAAGPA